MTSPSSPARDHALQQLNSIDPVGYGSTRNHLDGAVTRLSPYLRHGVLSLAEVRDVAIRLAGSATRCAKLLQELAWRDYYQRVWQQLGDAIWEDLEPYKTGFDVDDYADELPADFVEARTGIDYIDHFVNELHTTGYLHNHARMWLAAYVVHGRRVKWQAGARWFLSHLLDGDEASNNLSWQWVASTFSHKPYFFNRENVSRFSSGRFLASQPDDPFDGDYDSIAHRLFRPGIEPAATLPRDFKARLEPVESDDLPDPSQTLVWVHDGMMSPVHPAVLPGAACVFVWDDAWMMSQKHAAGRIAFQQSALFCEDIHTAGSSLQQALLGLCQTRGKSILLTGATPDPRLRRAIASLRKQLEVRVVAPEPLVELSGFVDLKRFSRYWAKAEPALLGASVKPKRAWHQS
jgi:deoxyribodipyrimidine photo-lyase